MSVFLAPGIHSDPKSTSRFRRYFFLGSLRRSGLFLAFLGIGTALVYIVVLGFFQYSEFVLRIHGLIGPVFDPVFLPFLLGLSITGLAAALISSYLSGRIALAGGKALLLSMVDDPGVATLTKLATHLGANILVRPTFRLGGENHPFDLAAVSTQGVVFLRTKPDPQLNPDVSSFRLTCKRLGEESGLILLTRLRFVQLWEPSLGPDWEVCQIRDLGRLFPRSEAVASHQETARTFRTLYNLALPAAWPKIPLEGPLPVMRGISSFTGEGRPRSSGGILVHLGRVVLLFLFLVSIAGAGVYALQHFDYEMAEKVVAPARAVLRRALPVEWQKRFGLGKEMFIGETGISVFVNARTGLSARLGEPAKGQPLAVGSEWHLIQMREYEGVEWCMIGRGARVGWLPLAALRPKRLVPRGTFLYARPDPDLPPLRVAERDLPAALLLLRAIPEAGGELFWAKVKLLDGTIAYVRDLFLETME